MIRAWTASVISTNGTSRANAISGTPRTAAAPTSAAGSAAGVPAPQFDGQAADARPGQLRDIRLEPRGRIRQRYPRGQHQLAAAQQPFDVGELDGVHPANGHVQPVRGGHHLRLAAADDVEVQHLAQCQRHRQRLYNM